MYENVKNLNIFVIQSFDNSVYEYKSMQDCKT